MPFQEATSNIHDGAQQKQIEHHSNLEVVILREKQFAACWKMLEQLYARIVLEDDLLSPPDGSREFLIDVAALLKTLPLMTTTDQEKVMQVLPKFLVGLYDVFVFEYMKKSRVASENSVHDQIPTALQTRYARDDRHEPDQSNENTFVNPLIEYVTRQEAREIEKVLKNDKGLCAFTTKNEFLSTPVTEFYSGLQIYIEEPLSEEDLDPVRQYFDFCLAQVTAHDRQQGNQREAIAPSAQLVAPIKMEGDIAGFINIKKTHQAFYPLSGVPRQDIFCALLKNGIAFESSNLPKPDSSFERIEVDTSTIPSAEQCIRSLHDQLQKLPALFSKASRAKRLLAAQTANFLIPEGEISNEKLIKREKLRCERLLGREHPEFGQGKVILTRSGVSANDMVIRAIADWFTRTEPSGNVVNPEPAYQLGWYYENLPRLEYDFFMASKPNLTRIFFLNHDSNKPTYEHESHYRRDYKAAIEQAKKTARQSSVLVFLVIDKTTHLLSESFADGEDIPPNLVVIETASLSKHQRGGKNYFAGMIQFWGPEELANVLQKQMVHSRGTITEFGAVHLPHLSRADTLIQERAHTRKAEEFEVALSTSVRNSEFGSLNVEKYTYFCYVFPPMHFLYRKFERVYKALGFYSNTANDFAQFLRTYRLDGESLLQEIFKRTTYSNYPTIEAADSFNLANIRVMAMPLDLPEVMGMPPGKAKSSILRISWGRDADLEECQRIGRVLAIHYYMKMAEIQREAKRFEVEF